MDHPSEPIVFMKATSALSGANDDIVLPRGSENTDWEAELGVVIGKRAKYVSQNGALEYVAGYCITNDVSERRFQLERGGQWVKGKSFDSFCPVGPWIATRDEIRDPQDLAVRLSVNGVLKQSGSTKNMIFDVAFIVSYLSEFMTLHPGDLICTGTPAGVGMGMTPPEYLKAGDNIQIEITGLGVQQQSVAPTGEI